jgi:hypothetical protein
MSDPSARPLYLCPICGKIAILRKGWFSHCGALWPDEELTPDTSRDSTPPGQEEDEDLTPAETPTSRSDPARRAVRPDDEGDHEGALTPAETPSSKQSDPARRAVRDEKKKP